MPKSASGLRWRKVDLHVHTPASRDYTGPKIAPAEFVAKALARGLSAIAITDHNSGEWIDRMVAAAKGTGLTVFPGVEVSTPHCHILAIFDTNTPKAYIDDFLTRVGIKTQDRGKKEVNSDPIEKVLQEIHDANGVAIAAHANSSNGMLQQGTGQYKIKLCRDPRVCALEFTNQAHVEGFTAGKISSYPAKACVQGSDSHSLAEVGTRRSFVKMDAPTLWGLSQALLDHDVRVRFGGIEAVGGASLSAAPGEIVGIIGPNGAGKTTLLDVISGFIAADAGQVLLRGRDLTGLGPDRRARLGLGRSFQDALLFPALTVEETIAVALERWVAVKDPVNPALHLPAAFDSEQAVRKRVTELIDMLGLEATRTKFVHELSTGVRRVVDLACVVAHSPSVVLLDEPSSGIAQRESEALAPLLLRLRDELGATLLLIEHDMPLITAVADRLVALDRGLVIATGPPAAVLRDPVVISSYLGDNTAAIGRSGALQT